MSQSGEYGSGGGGGSGTVEFLVGNSGGDVGPNGLGEINVLGGVGINVVGNPGTNTLTINNTGVGVTWSDKGTDFTASPGTGYFITGTATASLPNAPSQGDTISFTLDTDSILTIQAIGSQVIRIGGTQSSAAGTASSNSNGDSLTLVYRSSDTKWLSSSVIGTWSVT